MKEDRILFLHIGAHKTGTTAIQEFLNAKTNELANVGWELFRKLPSGSNSKLGNANTWINFKGNNETFKASINPSLVKELSKGTLNTILSSEELFWIEDISDVNSFYNELKLIYSKIIVCCYLRRQDEHLLSHYQQGYKFPYSTAFQFYGNSLCVIPEHKEYFRKYLDYSKKLEMWESLVGKGNLMVREYSKQTLKNGDAVSDFLILLPFKITKNESPKRTNESLNNVQVIINYNVFKIRDSLWYEIGKNAFTKNEVFGDSTKPMLTSDKRSRILNYYQASNAKLICYVPDLSKNWYSFEPSASDIEKNDMPIQFTTDDYEKALYSLVKYYDNLSIFRFSKYKFRKILTSTCFGKKIRSIFSNRKKR